MAKKYIEELWEPFEEYSGPPVEVNNVSPRRRTFMEVDSMYEYEVPGLLPRSRAMRELIEDGDER